jgi:hypothetical protein
MFRDIKDHSEDNSRIGIPAVSGTVRKPTECIKVLFTN